MRLSWPKLASLVQKTCTLDSFQFFQRLTLYRTYCNAHSLSLSTSHCPDMIKILLKKGVKSHVIHPSNYFTFNYFIFKT